MFFEKLVFGALGGGALGVVVAIAGLFQGKSIGEAGEAVMGCIMLGIIVVFWATRDKGGSDHGDAVDRDIFKLRRDLEKAHSAAASYAADGKHHEAAYWRSQVGIIESELRSRGA